METKKWRAYNDLAWTEQILAPPHEYQAECNVILDLIRQHKSKTTNTMLHLGCGAGGHDYWFKQEYQVTGIDLSPGMLEIARKTNPGINYTTGDMRTFFLNKKFDVVIIPDSIGYMTTLKDLNQAFIAACSHLKPGGIILIVAHTMEDFKENNFVYTGSGNQTEIILFENNYILKSDPGLYESTMVYLIREKGVQKIHSEIHTIGLFKRGHWLKLFSEQNIKVTEFRDNQFYQQYLLDDGEYPLSIFLGRKV